jgi:hypothetical protein
MIRTLNWHTPVSKSYFLLVVLVVVVVVVAPGTRCLVSRHAGLSCCSSYK